MRNAGRILLSLALAMPLGATSALAEGSFDTYFTGWLLGKTSRTWADRNIDGVITSIRVQGCSFPGMIDPNGGKELALRIQRYDPITPDDNMGTRDFEDCELGETRLWNDMSAATYYFKLQGIDDKTYFGWPARASASFVKVQY